MDCTERQRTAARTVLSLCIFITDVLKQRCRDILPVCSPNGSRCERYEL